MWKNIFPTLIVALAVISAAGSHILTLRGVPQVVSVETVQNLGLATFSDGTTRVLFHDYDYATMNPGWDVTTIIPALTADNGRQLAMYVAPQVTFRGSNWQREVYTYASQWDGCQKNILYINRDAKSSETIKNIPTAYCVDHTLNERDAAKFVGTSEDQKTMVIGSYFDGSIIATVALPDLQVNSDPGLLTSNWEDTKFAFFMGACDLGGDSLQILVWDTKSGSLVDQRSSLKLKDCAEPQNIVYNHDTDAFDIYGSRNGQDYIIGSVR